MPFIMKMSNTTRKVAAVHKALNTSDGAGVKLKRSIGMPDLDYIDPFLLLDEFSSDSPDEYIAGFPSHPHRGFETVTYMLNGSMKHEDSAGNKGELHSGSIQWMTAGSGIVHSEMPMQKDGLMRGFQLWVNLPQKYKMMKPRYQDIAPDEVPVMQINGGWIRILAGNLHGLTGPVQGIVTEPLYIDVELTPAADVTLDVPAGHSVFAYPFEGSVDFGSGEIQKSNLVEFADGNTVVARAGKSGGRFILLAARPIGEEIFRHGPFVMTTRDEILTAIKEYNNGTFIK